MNKLSYILDLEVDIQNDSVNSSKIEDRSSDFKLINDIWHFKGEIADNLMNIINEADGYYRRISLLLGRYPTEIFTFRLVFVTISKDFGRGVST